MTTDAMRVPRAVAATPRGRARMRDLVPAEWIKFRSLRSSTWTLVGLTLYCWYLGYAAADNYLSQHPHPSHQDVLDFSSQALLNNTIFFAPMWIPVTVVAGVVGAIAFTSEHASGLIRCTFTAVPDRNRVVLAKVVIVTAVLTLAGLASSIGSFAIGFGDLSATYPGQSMTSTDAIQAMVFTTVLFPVCGLGGLACAAVVRNAPSTILAVVGVFAFGPMLLKSGLYSWMSTAQHWQPAYAWWALIATAKGHIADSNPTTFTDGWVTFLGWSLITPIITVLALRRREV